MAIYLVLGVFGVALLIIVFASSAGCSPGTCMEGPLLLSFVLIVLYGLGFGLLGAIWLVTGVTYGRRRTIDVPPMPPGDPDDIESTSA